jgi:hypothetical protein
MTVSASMCCAAETAVMNTVRRARTNGCDGAQAPALHNEPVEDLRRCHLSRRPDRKPQYFAERGQILIARATVISLPKIDARRADADLLGNVRDR